jgi:hypothetical protein
MTKGQRRYLDDAKSRGSKENCAIIRDNDNPKNPASSFACFGGEQCVYALSNLCPYGVDSNLLGAK